MSNGTDSITRAELVRAIRATQRRLPERATGDEARERMALEVESPHKCEPLYTVADGGPCASCGEWVPA